MNGGVLFEMDGVLVDSERSGLKPEECLFVEDALSGIKAAVSAGYRCLAITTSFRENELTEADWICDSPLNVPEVVLNC